MNYAPIILTSVKQLNEAEPPITLTRCWGLPGVRTGVTVSRTPCGLEHNSGSVDLEDDFRALVDPEHRGGAAP